MPISFLSGGVWNHVRRPSILVGGVWKTVKAAWVLDGGVWHLCHDTLPSPTSLSGADQSFCDDGTGHSVPPGAGGSPHVKIGLAWSPAGAYQTQIWRDGSFLTTVAIGVSTYNDEFMGDNQTYNYTVRHYNGTYDSLDSNLVSVFVAPLSC